VNKRSAGDALGVLIAIHRVRAAAAEHLVLQNVTAGVYVGEAIQLAVRGDLDEPFIVHLRRDRRVCAVVLEEPRVRCRPNAPVHLARVEHVAFVRLVLAKHVVKRDHALVQVHLHAQLFHALHDFCVRLRNPG